jgi:signal transduction histidine kinase
MQILLIALLFIVVFQFISYRRDYSALEKDMKQKETSLDDAKIGLREVEILKSEIVSLAAHQIRSPLVAIEGYISMIKEGDFGQVDENMKEAISSISTSANYLMTLVNEFLNISRLEHGQLKFNMVNIELSTLVEDVMHEYHGVARANRIDFELIQDKRERYLIHADRSKTQKIISSIVDNAFKYTIYGWVKLELDKLDGKIRLTVKDTGIGIERSDQEKLFDKFFRTSSGNEVFVRGTGLSLYMAKHMLLAQGANVWVSSEGEGKGSTFVIEFEDKE